MGVPHVSVSPKLLGIPHGGTDRAGAKFLPLEIFRAGLGKSLAQSDWLWSQPCLARGVGLRSAERPANLNHSMHLWKKLYRSWHYREKCPSRSFSKPHKTAIITEFSEEHMSSQIRPFQVVSQTHHPPPAAARGRGFREKCVEPTINNTKEKFLPNPMQPVMGWCPGAHGLLSSLGLHLCSVSGDVLTAHAKNMFSWHTSEVIQSLLRPLLLKLSYCMPIKSLHHTILH